MVNASVFLCALFTLTNLMFLEYTVKYTIHYKYIYYITFNYMPCTIPPALLNNRMTISIGGPISNITVGPGPISVIGPAFLQLY